MENNKFVTTPYRLAYLGQLGRASNSVGKRLTQCWPFGSIVKGLLQGLRALVLEMLAQVRQLQQSSMLYNGVQPLGKGRDRRDSLRHTVEHRVAVAKRVSKSCSFGSQLSVQAIQQGTGVHRPVTSIF